MNRLFLRLPHGKNFGRLCVLAAAVMWSTNGLFVKSTVFDDWPVDERGTLLAFWRALFAGSLLLPAVRKPRWDPRLVPMALSFTLMNVTFLQSMTLTTAANAIWLQSTAPLWVFLVGLIAYRMVREPRDLAPVLCGLAGAAIIVTFELRANDAESATGRSHDMGVLLGLTSGIFYAGVVVFMRRLRDHGGPFLVAVNHLAAAALLAPYCIYVGQSVSQHQWPVLMAFGFFQMGLPYLLFARGLREISGQEGAGIALVEPVLTPLWVYLGPSGEAPAPWTVVGGALILLGLGWRYLRAAKETDAERPQREGEAPAEP
jgi:drug/metabolite transporter (DMT)-like permease